MCGEKNSGSKRYKADKGSPPRVRGEVVVARLTQTDERITPACAGRRKASARRQKKRWDHPRVCGEKSRSQALRVRFLGSPPRVRGEDLHDPARKVDVGITPACAGRSGLRREHSSG